MSISLLAEFSKIFDKVLYKGVIVFLNSISILTEGHVEFRKSVNC
jgi:hypothetical protein